MKGQFTAVVYTGNIDTDKDNKFLDLVKEVDKLQYLNQYRDNIN